MGGMEKTALIQKRQQGMINFVKGMARGGPNYLEEFTQTIRGKYL